MSKQVKILSSRGPAIAASELRFGDRAERAVGRNGELNASSKRDLFQQQVMFANALSSQNVLADGDYRKVEAAAKTRRELVQAAFNDKDAHRILGERISESLYMTCNRQGFARKFLSKINVEQGGIPRFSVRQKNVTAVIATGPTKVQSQIAVDKWLTPPEFDIIARPFIPQNELNQSTGDVLDEKFVEATEGVMVTEDRVFLKSCNNVVGLDNNLSIISGELTPKTLTEVAVNVTRWGLKVPNVLIATDLWSDIIGNAEFYSAMDPVARHELLMEGQIGHLYGMAVTTDAFRHPEHKVINAGEFYVFADALTLGGYSDRGGITSSPTDITVEQVAGKGWVLQESFALAVANSRAVAKGIRV